MGTIPWRASAAARVYSDAATVLTKSLHNAAEVPKAINLLCHFVREVNTAAGRTAPACDVLDPGLLRVPEDLPHVHHAWAHLQALGHWSPKRRQAVQRLLAAALLCVAPTLAPTVHPTLRGTQRIRFHTERSHRTDFDLHECLPWGVRCQDNRRPGYQLLVQIGSRISDHLRSVSRDALRAILGFFHRLFCHSGLTASWGKGASVEDRWRELRGLQALDWLGHYQHLYPQLVGRKDDGERLVTFGRFRKELRWLSLLHSRVLHGDERSQPEGGRIPVPRESGRIVVGLRHPLGSDEEEGAASSYGYSSAQSETSRRQQVRLYDEVSALRGRVVRHGRESSSNDPDAPGHLSPLTFTPAQVRAIVLAADGIRERLIIMLFLTTGLRRGGLCRLVGVRGIIRHANDVPDRLSTREKNNTVRVITCTPLVRLLIAQWYQYVRPRRLESPYLFPGARHGHMDEGTVARVCRGVFQRAQVHGPEGHCHAFRPEWRWRQRQQRHARRTVTLL